MEWMTRSRRDISGAIFIGASQKEDRYSAFEDLQPRDQVYEKGSSSTHVVTAKTLMPSRRKKVESEGHEKMADAKKSVT